MRLRLFPHPLAVAAGLVIAGMQTVAAGTDEAPGGRGYDAPVKLDLSFVTKHSA